MYTAIGRQGLKTYGRRKFQRRMSEHRFTQASRRAKWLRRGRRYPQVVTPIMVGVTRRGRMAGQPVELKFHDLDIDDATVAAGGTIAQDSCNLIAQGVTEAERIGRKCTLRSINWRFQLSINAGTTSNTADTIRVLLYLDKQANGATAAVLDIIETADFQSFNNLTNKSRFRTLMDRTYTLNAPLSGDGTTLDSGKYEIADDFFKKVNIPIEYSDGTANLTAVRSNNIGLLLLGSDGVASFSSKMRIRFSDT